MQDTRGRHGNYALPMQWASLKRKSNLQETQAHSATMDETLGGTRTALLRREAGGESVRLRVLGLAMRAGSIRGAPHLERSCLLDKLCTGLVEAHRAGQCEREGEPRHSVERERLPAPRQHAIGILRLQDRAQTREAAGRGRGCWGGPPLHVQRNALHPCHAGQLDHHHQLGLAHLHSARRRAGFRLDSSRRQDRPYLR